MSALHSADDQSRLDRLGEVENKTLEWSYEEWSSSAQTPSNEVLTPIVAVPAAAALGVTILVFAVKKRKKR